MSSTRGTSETSDAKKPKASALPVGPVGQRRLRKRLQESENPSDVIQSYQQDYSLHSMVARALATTPMYEAHEKVESINVESLDTDPVMKFLSHLGVPLHIVHKRVVEALRSQLDDEIRKTNGDESSLLNLLRSCFQYATTVPELRPVLWDVLKQLGPKTPKQALIALSERDPKTGLKHKDIFENLQPLLKGLVWEADWDKTVPIVSLEEKKNKDVLSLMEESLFGETITPLINEYCSQESLVTKADLIFVVTNRERRVATTQRRALNTSTNTVSDTKSSTSSRTLQKLSQSKSPATASLQSLSTQDLSDSGRVVSKIRAVLGASSGVQPGTSSSPYRTKLLYAILSLLMAQHGVQDPEKDMLLGGSSNLHCTLLSDIFLSSAGSLPKPFRHLVLMVRTLDDCVKAGELSDAAIATVQSYLKIIFQGETATSATSGQAAATSSRTALQERTDATKQELKRVIDAALSAMKKSDPNNLFLNPVTDEIAPGYSKVIKRPMCMKTMESKLENLEYTTIEEFERDVQLMYHNCITYNIGNEGQWFRGEARRQTSVFKDHIFPEAKKLYQQQIEKSKRAISAKGLTTEQKKRKTPGPLSNANESVLTSDDIEPLNASKSKKRKRDNQQEYVPSVPVIASMVLADPFVVRLMLDRVLRLLRMDVMRSEALPTAHKIVPSILQLLHIAQSSCQLCALRGRKYYIPGAGVSLDFDVNGTRDDDANNVLPYETLRRVSPLLMRLLLESELDRRMASGGDLFVATAAQSTINRPGSLTSTSCLLGKGRLSVSRSLLEGAIVNICQPGNWRESSLTITFPKFAIALQSLATNVWYERPFFVSLIQSLLKHKSKLSKSTRDVVVNTWLGWFAVEQEKNSNELGAMATPMHECLLLLLNEWAALGNLLLPRDDLLKFSYDAVQASEHCSKRKFVEMWHDPVPAFVPIKTQYIRMLHIIPTTNAASWKEKVGITDDESSSIEPKDP